jgi:hypothetical protein
MAGVLPTLAQRVARAGLIHDRDRHELRLLGARTIEVIVDLLHGICLGVAVALIHGADRAFDYVRYRNARGNSRARRGARLTALLSSLLRRVRSFPH